MPLRIDLFGDEIESIRLFDPVDQRTVGNVDHFDLLPVSEFLLDEASVTRFRTRYRELFGAVSTSDPLYQTISDNRRLSGMEHWLPLFYDSLRLLDHPVRDCGAGDYANCRNQSFQFAMQNRH